MAVKNRPQGICHICGQHGDLSFEHVPPEKAFNDRPAFLLAYDELFTLGPDDEPQSKPIKQQRGAGGFTLCDSCNSKTGSWYGDRFINWCCQAALLLERSEGKPTLLYPYYIYPLAVLKQIVSLFLSINNAQMQARHQELARFVLNREAQYLNPKYRFFVYYNIEGRPRMLPFAAKMNIFEGSGNYLSEITYFPFGYVMTIDSDPPDRRLLEITHFSRYGYSDLAAVSLQLPVLPTHVILHGDYRSREEIHRTRQENEEWGKRGGWLALAP
jgi:hypothetical protein